MKRFALAALLLCVCALQGLHAQERGPWFLIGKHPDLTPPGCTVSDSGTRVPDDEEELTDSDCGVWSLGDGDFPAFEILLNGSNGAAGGGLGSEILWLDGVIYVHGNSGMMEGDWYVWDGDSYENFGPDDPEGGGGSPPVGYFVSTTGSDSNTCMQASDVATPKATFASALTCVSAGDTLWARGGTYNQNITTSPSGTNWGNKVRIAHYPGDSETWLIPTTATGGSHIIWFDCNCHYIEFDGINLDGRMSDQAGLWVSTNNGNDPHHIRFQNAEVIAGDQGAGAAIDLGAHTTIGATGSNEIIRVVIHGGGLPGLCGFACASYGVYIKGPNNLVEECEIYDTSGAGIQIYNAGADPPDGNILRNNIIRDITRTGSGDEVWGIIVVGDDNLIYNNVITGISVGNSNPGNAGITVGNGTDNNRLLNNTIYNNTNSGIYIGTGTNIDVQNNIIYLSTGTNYIDNGTATTHSGNLEGTNPGFVSGSNFHLQSSSPARNIGDDLSGTFTTDIEGFTRSAWDAGAYEYH